MRWWHSLAAVGALLAALAAALALTVAGLRPTTTDRGHPSAAGADDRRPPLRFGSGGGFKVALFADLHYGENAWTDWGPAQDAGSDRVMAAVLDAEKPDFVVYLGDLVTANNLPIPNASLYWDRAVSAARGRGVPWASVFGNHDDMPFEWPPEWFSPDGVPPLRCPPPASTTASGEDQGCSFRGTPRIDLITAEICKNRLSYSSNGPKDLWPGVSNYVLQVLSRAHDDPALLMYFLDSGGGSYTEVVSSGQVKWFQSQSQFLNPNGRIPELIFWHIPSTAYVKVAPKAKSEIRKPCVGSINKEDVAPQTAEWGMMDALSKRPSVKAIFVGHNHGLDWCCPYEKMWLCFARHTGYGGYGNWPRGARIIQITENPFSTVSWIRMENGTKHSDVTLSS
ncbi:putative inactive purple acid phosphatase 16 [Dichanthelium oligosanthes]|uniref:Putative inactive purple acid phosphatase 16 n=1 Tax=Dichanthelium oligosanthes TaxID=888268 RepID=A0A1E5WKA7_9POAL|nr:putative inactive purple acid phosphatase 16 [Dichanthelium oligosanthes]